MKKIKYMLDHSIAEPSASSRASPCSLVDKTDKSPKFCADYGKINTVTRAEAFPLPHYEDCDQSGAAMFVPKIDLLEGMSHC